MNIAARNRAIKSTLAKAFGHGKVTVRGSRGTAWGYVRVQINHTPRDWEQSLALQRHCKALLRAAGIDLGFAYTDDTCQHATDQCSISFNRCRFERVFAGQDTGQLYGKPWDSEEWIAIPRADSQAGR